MIRTYQTRLHLTVEQQAQLVAYADLYGRVERTLFARLAAGDGLNHLKQSFQKRFGITARQFNAVHAGLKGKIDSIKSRRHGLMDDLVRRIKRARQVLKRATNPAVRHQKKRRLAILEHKLDSLKADRATGTVRLCFGSRKLFRAQFHMEDNGYANVSAWKQDWQSARRFQFMVLGSKDETAGCQGCVATVGEDGSITLRLRLPNAATAKYTQIGGLSFAHGHAAILAAIGRNLSGNKLNWQAITYRFVKDDTGWRVFVSVALPEVRQCSDRHLGVIGIDINTDHLAITETDRFGNPIGSTRIPCCTYGKSSEQSRAIIGDAVKQVIATAKSSHKPIAIERLDFQKKKASLEKESPRYARMLSSFTYTQIQTVLRSRAFDTGIAVLDADPAYTSIVGQYKYAKRYGISVHQGAALAIGRKGLGFREAVPSQLAGTLSLPVRNRDGHVANTWDMVARKLKAAHAAHSRSVPHTRSARLEPCTTGSTTSVINPAVGGEIPPCYSSLIPFE